jgi:hypothetical protein
MVDFLKKSSVLTPLDQMNQNLVGSIPGSSSIMIADFVPIRLQTWPSRTILVSDWSISKKSSSLKPLYQINRNLVASSLEWSSITIVHFVLIRQQTSPS